ncbi:MAG TPA: 23S rRNA (guanosine(2251)-2'-O)-methyltransferase RlmB [Clostridiales bacterium]|nr:23S rRNA (guanosine(2251)-2'-O)-methyltransferase RlmB [Clostridiales bacterium]
MEYDRKNQKSRNDRGNRDNRDGVKKPRFAQGGPERGDKSRREGRKTDAKPYAKSNAKPYRKPTERSTPKPTVEAEDVTQAVPAEGIHGDYENGAVIGRSAVRELLKSERPIDKILVQKGERTGSITVLVAQAIARKIPVIEVERQKLDSVSGFAPHQGIVAMAAEKEYCTVADILAIAKERGEAPLVVICDGVTDPYNLGAIIRCAECCGAHGLVIPKRRAAGLTPLVTKASAGAIEHLAIAKVPNIAAAVEELKEAGVWVYAAEAGGSSLWKTDFSGACAIVMGSEGDGVSQVVKKACDGIVSIPIYGQVNSFNVSTAAAVILAEVARQQHKEG